MPRIQSTCKQGRRLSEESRAYFPEQVELIARSLPASSSLAVRIAHATGVRARELLTLRRAEHVPASTRRLWSEARFSGRTGVRYALRGKGGLRHEVLIPTALANELEQLRLSRIQRVKDRGTVYWSVLHVWDWPHAHAGGRIDVLLDACLENASILCTQIHTYINERLR